MNTLFNKITARGRIVLTSVFYLLLTPVSCLLTSCASEFDNDYMVSKPSVVSETEELSSYGTLLEYATYRLGNSLTTAVFLDGGPATTQTLTNFNELTLTDAFLHNSLVAADGSVDTSAVAQIADQAQTQGISLFGSALCSSTNVNGDYLNGLIAPDLVELDETTGTDVWRFEDDELGITYDVKTAAGAVKGNAVVEDDPDGQSGHVVHVTKTNQSFPVFTLELPEGRKLGDYKKLRIDFKDLNKTAVTQGIFLILAGKSTEMKKAADYGCVQDAWGRQLIEFDLSILSLTEEQNALTTASTDGRIFL